MWVRGRGEVTEDDDGDIDRAKDTELVGLFEKTILALRKYQR